MLIVTLNEDFPDDVKLSEWSAKRHRAIELAWKLGRNVVVRLPVNGSKVLEYTRKGDKLDWKVLSK